MSGDFAPYRVVDSGTSVDEVTARVNESCWYAYGQPDGVTVAAPLASFAALLDDLAGLERVTFVTHAELLAKPPAPDAVRIGLRMDIDSDIVAADQLAELAQERNVGVTFVVLHTAPYYGDWAQGEDGTGPVLHRHEAMAPTYRHLQDCGHEVSLHADPLGLYLDHRVDGSEGMLAELAWLRSIGLTITGTTAHNHRPAYGAENYEVFTDVLSPSRDALGPDATVIPGTDVPLRTVDRTAAGLAYEGNEAFWRPGVPVEYGAIHADDAWYWTDGSLTKPLHADDWVFTSVPQARVIADIADLPGGTDVVLVVHPEYYGARTGPDQAPTLQMPAIETSEVGGGEAAASATEGYARPAMADLAPVTVIDFRSLSYTGTTWLNLLAGSHPSVFSLVLPQRVYGALRGELPPEQVCMLHQADCPFWPAALPRIDLDANLYAQIASLSGASHLVLNNPFIDPRGMADLEAPEVDVRKVTIVRDPRAMVASYLSRMNATVPEAIRWVVDNAGLADVAPGIESVRFRYEDVVADQHAYLDTLGSFVGLTYDESAVRFWEHEHHPAGGNGGPFNLIGRHHGGPSADASIEARYERVIADPLDVANPARWADALTADDLALLTEESHALRSAWGYDW